MGAGCICTTQPDTKTTMSASKTRQSSDTGGALGGSCGIGGGLGEAKETSGERIPGVSPGVVDALGVIRGAGVKPTGVEETLLSSPDTATPVSGAPVGASKYSSTSSSATAAAASFFARFAARVRRFTSYSIPRICGTRAEAGDAARAVRAAG